MKDNVDLPIGLGPGKKVLVTGRQGLHTGLELAKALEAFKDTDIEVIDYCKKDVEFLSTLPESIGPELYKCDTPDPLVGRDISLNSAALDNRHEQITTDMLDEFVKDLSATSALEPTSPFTDDGNIHHITKRHEPTGHLKYEEKLRRKAIRAASLKQKNRKRKKNKKTHR